MPALATALMLAILAQAEAPAPAPADRTSVLVVAGTPGTPEYAAEFRQAVDAWRAAAAKAPADFRVIGIDGSPDEGATDRDALHKALAETPTGGREAFWLVMVGHGTFDGKEAKFNLRGPDVTAAEMAEWLKPFTRPLAILDGSSASGPFLNALSAPGRVVIVATRSGDEQNYARLGLNLAEAVADPRADLDRDDQVSLLEAFLTAAGRTAEFYKSKSRLATEHPLIDDDGDKLGTPADWFKGLRAVKKPAGGKSLDGSRARQIHLIPNDRDRRMSPEARDRRDQLEREAADLRGKKETLSEDEYYARLETIMLQLARIHGGDLPASER